MSNDPSGDPWLLSPSGSRADDSWNNQTDYETDDIFLTGMEMPTSSNVTDVGYLDEEDSTFSTSFAFGADLRPGELMSTKAPPAWNGRGSWFAYEELVYDWIDITVLDDDKRGPALKARLCDAAVVFKTTLDREKLKQKENAGVEYFLKELCRT